MRKEPVVGREGDIRSHAPTVRKEDHAHAQQYVSFSWNQDPGHGMESTTVKVGLHSINMY